MFGGLEEKCYLRGVEGEMESYPPLQHKTNFNIYAKYRNSRKVCLILL